MALRALAVDRCATSYLAAHPRATVVALAEGFQTSFWRLDRALPAAQFNWISVDLPPIIGLRQRLLPHSTRITELAQSALDYTWMDKIDNNEGVFVTAEGLLMYLQPREANGLIAECAKRFPGGQMFFSVSARQLANLADTMPGVRAVHDVPMPRGRGLFFGILYPALWNFAPMKPFRGAYTLLDFG